MSDGSAAGADRIAVGKCPNCGPVYGDRLEYRFPNPSVCSCGSEVEKTTFADAEKVRSLRPDTDGSGESE